jgi:TolB-like protein/Tfp pilus assembly protein PilF
VIYRFGDAELDTHLLCLRVGSEIRPLPPKGFFVLLHLIRNRSRVVPKRELFEVGWPGVTVTEGSLAQCVRQIRRALQGTRVGEDAIVSVYGQGYRFGARVDETPHGAGSFGGRPAIVVLPFRDLSPERREEWLADGLVEDLTQRIASYRWLPVIATSSALARRADGLDTVAAATDLGARYAVEGSVRRAGSRVRVDARLVDAETGRVLAAHEYDGQLGDVLALQEEVAGAVIGALHPELVRSEIQRAVRAAPRDLAAWELFMRGLWHHLRYTPADGVCARELFAEAAARDPGFAAPLAFTGLSHLNDANAGWTRTPGDSVRRALAASEAAVRIDADDPFGQAMLGGIYAVLGRREESIALFERALERDPSFALAHWGFGRGLSVWGRAREAIEHFRRAIRLSPRDPALPHFHEGLAFAHYFRGEFDVAAAHAERSVQLAPDWPRSHLLLSASYAMAGDARRARAALPRFRELEPAYNLDVLRKSYALARAEPGLVESLIEGIQRAEAASARVRAVS